MPVHTLALYAAFAATLAAGTYAAHTQEPASPKPAVASSAAPPLRWVPDWLMAPLSRTIAGLPDSRKKADP